MNSNNSKRILIIGCGWLGKKLGSRLIGQGYQVTGTTRSESNFESISSLGIEPHILDVSPNPDQELSIPENDATFISLSPDRKGGTSDYAGKLKNIGAALGSRPSKVILFSSTSAYSDQKGRVTEADAIPDPESENHILAAEGALWDEVPDALILRFAGLYGGDRHPVHFLAGRKNISNGDAPVNLIHSEDIIQICERLISKDHLKGEVFNISADEHPAKSTIYRSEARKRGLELPEFKSGGKEQKSVSNKKIKEELQYSFIHPDPMNS